MKRAMVIEANVIHLETELDQTKLLSLKGCRSAHHNFHQIA